MSVWGGKSVVMRVVKKQTWSSTKKKNRIVFLLLDVHTYGRTTLIMGKFHKCFCFENCLRGFNHVRYNNKSSRTLNGMKITSPTKSAISICVLFLFSCSEGRFWVARRLRIETEKSTRGRNKKSIIKIFATHCHVYDKHFKKRRSSYVCLFADESLKRADKKDIFDFAERRKISLWTQLCMKAFQSNEWLIRLLRSNVWTSC